VEIKHMTEPVSAVDADSTPSRLREARRRRGLTQEEVAERLGMARTTLVAIEKGERRVQPDELVQLARLYGASLEEIQRPTPPVEPLAVQLRGRASVHSPIDVIAGQLEQLCDDYLELERITGAPLLQRYPPEYPIGKIAPSLVAEAIAQAERNRLGLGDGPVSDLRELLENEVGLRVFSLPLPSDVAAMFAYAPRIGGCVAFNSDHPYERQRWSLAHEYAHFLTSRRKAEVTHLTERGRVPQSERLAEDFAAEFLMPAIGLTRRFYGAVSGRSDGATAADLLHLAHAFGVSAQAMVVRLEGLRLVSMGTWDALVDRGLRVGAARSLLGIPARESDRRLLPARFYYLAAEANIRGDLSEGQLARYLRLDRVQARRLVQSLSEAVDVDENGAITTASLPLSQTGG
jgi:Zn-dependent peptidase ImmA (M78 family)/DNA-binding XRE family transcriptional regulator